MAMIKEAKKPNFSQFFNSEKSTNCVLSQSRSITDQLFEPDEKKTVTCYTFSKEAGVDTLQATKLYYSTVSLHVWGGRDFQ